MKGKTLEAIVRKLRSIPAKQWSAKAKVVDDRPPGITVLATHLESEYNSGFWAYLYQDRSGHEDNYRLLVRAGSSEHVVIDERSPAFRKLYGHTMAKIAAQYKTGLAQCLSIQ